MRTASIIRSIMMIEAVCTSETSVYFKQTTRRYNPGGSHVYNRHRENMKFQADKMLSIFN
jgi:hypothetical protein